MDVMATNMFIYKTTSRHTDQKAQLGKDRVRKQAKFIQGTNRTIED